MITGHHAALGQRAGPSSHLLTQLVAGQRKARAVATHIDVSPPVIATVRRQHISDPGQTLHNVPASADLERVPAIVTAPSLFKSLKPR